MGPYFYPRLATNKCTVQFNYFLLKYGWHIVLQCAKLTEWHSDYWKDGKTSTVKIIVDKENVTNILAGTKLAVTGKLKTQSSLLFLMRLDQRTIKVLSCFEPV